VRRKFCSYFQQVTLHNEHCPQFRDSINLAPRDWYKKHREWFATGKVKAIERTVLNACKPFVLDALQLSFGDGVLERVF
jgi:hypothetical protein